jgi:hypothetical protein
MDFVGVPQWSGSVEEDRQLICDIGHLFADPKPKVTALTVIVRDDYSMRE